MGCQSSQIQRSLQVRLCIIDSNFMRSSNQKVKEKMQRVGIKYEAYVSLSCFIQDMTKIYSNDIVATEQQYSSLQKQLKKLNYSPNIYLITGKQQDGRKQNNIFYCKDYQDIIKVLSDKQANRRKSTINPLYQKSKKVTIKIFRSNSTKQTEEIIFQQTLKNKNISFESYNTFSELQKSIFEVSSDFILSDYVYHRQVLNLVGKKATKVICYCDLSNEQTYDPRTYFITNNFLQITSQLASQLQLSNMNSVKCSKVYIYAPQESYITEYAQTIQNFGFGVKVFSDLQKIMKQTKYFFCCTIIIDTQQKQKIQKVLQKNDYLFKTKLIEIKKGTQNSVKGLRKIFKQMKKGYKALKGKSRSVDIIDKHFDNVKFDEIKKELEKNNINCYGYVNLNNYIKQKKFVSPFIICNYEQRMLLIRYLNQINSTSKIVLFCNKNNITSELKQSKQFAFVNSHFGKIMKFIKKTEVYNPYMIDQNQNKIKQKKQKLKNGNRRISALKWCQNSTSKQGADLNQLQKNFQFLNIKSKTNQSQIKQIQKQSSSLFKLDYKPTNNTANFKKDFIQSLKKLKTLLKINYPDNDFNLMVTQIQKMTSSQLLTKIKQFFKSENQLGLKINKALINVEKLTKEQIIHMRQFLYLVNLNFLSQIKSQSIGRIKLSHFSNQDLLQKCQVGSYILNKNYFICYQKNESTLVNEKDSDHLSKMRIDFQIQYNSLAESQFNINSYFLLKDKFVFSPFSQFMIKKINKQANLTIIEVQYKKNIQFLRCFYSDNLLQSNQSIPQKFNQQIKKIKNSSQESLIVDFTNVQSVQRNLIRCKALTLFKNQQFSKAIDLQKQLIIREQNLQNFDSIKLNQLNYQLAFFYFKNEKYQQCKQLLTELLEAEPGNYLKDRIKKLLSIYKQLKEKPQIQNKQIIETFSLNNIQKCQQDKLDLISQSQSDEASQQKEKQVFNFEFPCMEMDKADQFQYQEKENIC